MYITPAYPKVCVTYTTYHKLYIAYENGIQLWLLFNTNYYSYGNRKTESNFDKTLKKILMPYIYIPRLKEQK